VSGAPNPDQLREFESSQNGLASALSRLLVVVERYPELRATQNFRDLQAQLEGSEHRIAVERRRFNESAQAFNAARRRFLAVLMASMLGFDETPYFAAEEGAEEAPAVQF
jgi:LemA protein